MDMISLQGKTNFFEKRVSEYQKAGVKLKEDGKNQEHKLTFDDDDFWIEMGLYSIFMKLSCTPEIM